MRFQSEPYDFVEDIGLSSCVFHQHADHSFLSLGACLFKYDFCKVLNHSSIKQLTQLTV